MESICVQHKVKLHLTNIYNNIEFKIGTSWHQKELKEVHYLLRVESLVVLGQVRGRIWKVDHLS